MSRLKRTRLHLDAEDGSTTSEQEVRSDPPLQTKKKKVTAAQNAAAIDNLDKRVASVDNQLATQNAQLASITGLLTQLTQAPTQHVAAPAQSLSAPPPAAMTLAPAKLALEVTPDPSPQVLTPTPQEYGGVGAAHLSQFPAPGLQQQSLTTSRPRARHQPAGVTTTAHQPAPAWGGPPGITPRQPAASNIRFAPAPARLHTDLDRISTLHDFEDDAAISKRVVEALQVVANPFATATGRQCQFPHQFVTRGQKMQKTTLGELSIGEYIWGLIQLIKSKEQSYEDIVFMNQHLEKVAEDAKAYKWESVRSWSEEVCIRVKTGRLAWSNTYEIDRLQTKISHKLPQELARDTVFEKGAKDDRVYKIPSNVKHGKPGPPCKEFQHGKCSQVRRRKGVGVWERVIHTDCLAEPKCENPKSGPTQLNSNLKCATQSSSQRGTTEKHCTHFNH